MGQKKRSAGKRQQEEGIRLATGNKFSNVLDAYLYAVAQVHADEVSLVVENDSWYAVMYGGEDTLDLLWQMAKSQKVIIALTDAEIDTLAGSGGVIIMEDAVGFVEVMYFHDEEECEVSWEALMESESRIGYGPFEFSQAEDDLNAEKDYDVSDIDAIIDGDEDDLTDMEAGWADYYTSRYGANQT